VSQRDLVKATDEIHQVVMAETEKPVSVNCTVQYRTVASGTVLMQPSGALCEQATGDRSIAASRSPDVP